MWGGAAVIKAVAINRLPQPRFTRKRRARLAPKFAFAALLFAGPALAAPRAIDDCEAIKDPSAYNLCLASFGPVRGQHGASYPGVAAEGERGGGGAAAKVHGSSSAARHASAGLGRGAAVSHGHAGRVRMEFTPGRR